MNLWYMGFITINFIKKLLEEIKIHEGKNRSAKPQQPKRVTPKRPTPVSTPVVSLGNQTYAEATATTRDHNRSLEVIVTTHINHSTPSVTDSPSLTATESPKTIKSFDLNPPSPLNSLIPQNTSTR
uniref:Uncharacterized protein n=1 Tax=Graphocephala atropunctata TaxID=36148 RepID=A0A1B6MT85_9HEMI